MKKYVIISAIYAGLGLAGGVFYREFTKINKYEGLTALGRLHPHLLGLGMLFFLLIGLLALNMKLEEKKSYKAFFLVYNVGLVLTSIMLLVRGILEVKQVSLDKTANSLVSTFAGIGHMVIAAGIILLFVALFKSIKEKNN